MPPFDLLEDWINDQSGPSQSRRYRDPSNHAIKLADVLGISLKTTGIARCPAVVDPHVAAVGPAQLLQPLQERRDAGLCLPIVGGEVHQHADASHPIGLLRPRRERPRGCRAAEERDEFASFHRDTSRQARRS
jgi:hypothetical protein